MKKTLIVALATLVLFAACGDKDDKPQAVGPDAGAKAVPISTPDVGASQPEEKPAPVALETPSETIASEDGEEETQVAAPAQQRTQTRRTTTASLGDPRDLVPFEEHILASDVVARVRLRTIEPSFRWTEENRARRVHYGFVTITFDVLEALKGSPGTEAVVELLVGNMKNLFTEEAALAVSRGWIAERDTQWDSNEAVVFLWNLDRTDMTVPGGRPASIRYVFADKGHDAWGRDHYSVFSDSNKAWLPGTSGSSPSFYTDDPALNRTMTLTETKALVTTTLAEVDPSIEGHAECVLAKYREQTDGRPKLPEFLGERKATTDSGQAANSVAFRYETGSGVLGSPLYPRYSLDGPDASLFSIEVVDNDTTPTNEYWVETKALRPLHADTYAVHLVYQRPEFFPCGYVPNSRVKYSVTAAAPDSVLHELFFDPVTVGTAVAADATNGVLKPASFTDADGGSATLSSISYESGTVEVEVTPDDALDDHIVDIIELDGTVSLSLDVFDATVDSANDTLSWNVSSQPWEDGDLLMVRIREVPPSCKSRTVIPGTGTEPALVSDCEALLGLKDALPGTGTLNWSLDTAITNWDGVTVSGTPRRVTELDLASRSLTGVVPVGLGELTGLERLALDHNFLTGGIPMELGGLIELEHMDLSQNMLSGSIPPELGNLSMLTNLFLISNDLSGEIPSELGNLSELEQLLLSGNDLTGPIPAELGGLSKLRELWLYENRLSGAIPPEFGGLTSVRVLDLNDNDLSGSIPWELGELSDLLRLALSDNRLEGCIRPSLRNISSHDLDELGLPDCTQDGRVPTPGGLAVTLSSGTFTITWSAVTGAAEYEAQHQVSGSSDGWTGLPATSGTSATYSPTSDPSCGTTYEFRLRSYGDGTTYVAGWSAESAVESVTTELCSLGGPEFDAASYDFSISEAASVDDVVGTVSATDPDASDTVSYAITSGNGDGKFAIDDETGEITVARRLDYETTPSYTLTVEAGRRRSTW